MARVTRFGFAAFILLVGRGDYVNDDRIASFWSWAFQNFRGLPGSGSIAWCLFSGLSTSLNGAAC